MEISLLGIAVSIFSIVVLTWWAWRVVSWVYVRPKKLEKCLREQGLSGNSYRFLFGDMKESSKMTSQAKSKPINFTHDIAPRVLSFVHHVVNNYGMCTITLPYCLLIFIMDFVLKGILNIVIKTTNGL